MEQLLCRFLVPDTDPTPLLVLLVGEIRPAVAGDFESARRNLQALCYILGTRPELRAALRAALGNLLRTHRHSELYTATGILPNTGFVSEGLRRIGHKLLPDVLEPGLLRTVLRAMFDRASDRHWVVGVGNEAWLQLIAALRFDEDPRSDTLPQPLVEMLSALRVLSYWIAALGTEPELLRLEPSLEAYESPFVAQNRELTAYIETYAEHWGKPLAADRDDRQLRVLFSQCRDVIERVRRNAARNGTSIRLTYHLQRLRQLLQRSEQLLDILVDLQPRSSDSVAYPPMVSLFTQLVRDECLRNNLYRHWRQNTELIALRVTDNASHHGEHYITETRQEYWSMARSAMIGGFVIAFMACLKIVLAGAQMPPLTGAIAFCLNYGLGFCLIHILHGTVATKQPAMTANAIAASISEAGGKLRDIEALTVLITRTCRTQVIAILGNVCIAIPLSALIAFAVFSSSGQHFTSPEKSLHLLEEQSLVDSGAVFYAAIAGVCLFISGLISGYYDNYAAYNRIPERILQLAWPRRLFGEKRMQRIAAYIGDNLGALAGNLLFGFLLGGTTLFGVLLGLPIDIRHVAFSSAFVGIAMAGLDFAPDLRLLVWAVLGVAGIGFLNLAVSFALALNVALRSRQVSDSQWRTLVRTVLRNLRRQPRDFFLPPKEANACLVLQTPANTGDQSIHPDR
ncbi:MAG: site-specific recombinase [Candidatus Accumulibacter sp.]|jgi:site-specific recombinase|uniref:site-specific recombinase n=1 Tax=Candidatus Accumulibacter TaxID=327159 RepID=UPI00208D9329|nr:site-specific recombinase [Accumulibacter sp.]MBK8113986.1 site-specific recombinase [Accumulibacter sp.]MBK8577874.1 site-specific recombinase [Candidatus Accumulibacter propinquus]